MSDDFGGRRTRLMRELWGGLAEAVKNDPSPEHRQGTPPNPLYGIAYGWHRRLIREGEAAFVLNDSGFWLQASPHRRSMIEHAAFLQWVNRDGPTMLETLSDARVSTLTKLRGIATNAGYSISTDGGWLEDYDAYKHSIGTYLHMAHLLPEFGKLDLLVPWLMEGAESHASLNSSQQFVRSQGSTDQLSREPLDDERQESAMTATIALHTLLWGSDAMREISPEVPWSDVLDETSAAADALPLTRRLSDET